MAHVVNGHTDVYDYVTKSLYFLGKRLPDFDLFITSVLPLEHKEIQVGASKKESDYVKQPVLGVDLNHLTLNLDSSKIYIV